MTKIDQDVDLQNMAICYFGTYRKNYVRNEVMIAGLKTQGNVVYECHVPLWTGVEDRVSAASGGWLSFAFFWRLVKTYTRLIWRFWQAPAYDILIVGYPGQFDVFLAKLLNWLNFKKRPVVLDILMSLHLIAEERGLVSKHPLTGRLIFFLEKWGLKVADHLIADTSEYFDYYVNKYRLNPGKFLFVPLGVDDRLYFPREVDEVDQQPHGRFEIIYYGTFIPLHGVDTILRAAALLQGNSDVHFSFYGEGQEKPMAVELANDLGLKNVDFYGWADKTQLPDKIADSDICLGVFGNTKQARCTIQNKIWEGLMMQRPVITGDSETVREYLVHGEEVFLVPRQNPQELAHGILTLKNNPDLCLKLVENGFKRVQQNTIASTGKHLTEQLRVLN